MYEDEMEQFAEYETDKGLEYAIAYDELDADECDYNSYMPKGTRSRGIYRDSWDEANLYSIKESLRALKEEFHEHPRFREIYKVASMGASLEWIHKALKSVVVLNYVAPNPRYGWHSYYRRDRKSGVAYSVDTNSCRRILTSIQSNFRLQCRFLPDFRDAVDVLKD